ncbi:putative reverse transcriptase domain-containing protein [Tanacetum coccineum]
MEQVFEICKCAEDDKVKFAVCTFEGRALTWWNGNVQTLGLANANQIPWSNVKAMMTTEYCPATEIQRMEQELWTLTLKGDDIEAYNNRFHELVLMCPECKAHHQPGSVLLGDGNGQRLVTRKREDCRTRIPIARDNPLQNVTCFGCGNHGHYMSDCQS